MKRYEHALSGLEQRAQANLEAEGFAPGEISLAASLSMRYNGQGFEIDVPLAPAFLAPAEDTGGRPEQSPAESDSEMSSVAADFHFRHQTLYGYSKPGRAIEAVQLRLRAAGRTSKPALPIAGYVAPAALPDPDSLRAVIFNQHELRTPVFHRSSLRPGMQGVGPAIVITGESTAIVAPGWAWSIDGAGTLVASMAGTRVEKAVRRAR